MSGKQRSNGYGSRLGDIHVVVEKPYDQVLKDDGWDVISESESATTFHYVCGNSYRGDDESIVTNLYHAITDKDVLKHFSIDWDASVY